MFDDFRSWLISLGLTETLATFVIDGLEVLAVALAAYVADVVARRIMLQGVAQFTRRTRTDWDDTLVERKVFQRLAHLAPAVLVWNLAPVILEQPMLILLARRGSEIYMLLVGLLVADALLNSTNDIYQSFEVSRRIPILGYLQVIKILLTVVVGILAVSIVIEKSPLVLLTGLGALTAVILLIFKDSILGLVAGIQLVANDMVRPGDWIEMPKYGADGNVTEITLNTVKVRNFDKTIVTIPTYALIADSFRNWRGMSESGGRRIKRSIFIDVNSIKFCTPEEIEKLSKIVRIKDYIENKQQELAAFNHEHHIDESVVVNGRRMTNIGTFRAYVVAYLRHHPKIRPDMTFLVRHLQPTEKGLPLEIYVFSRDQAWVNYEAIQADIFDHLFAALPEFKLRPFQNPSGQDLGAVADALQDSAKSMDRRQPAW